MSSMNQGGGQDPASDPTTWPTSFVQFWALYLAEHGNQRTRSWHYAGSLSGIGAGLLVFGFQYARNSFFEALILGLFVALVVSYGLSLLSHWVVEGNPPQSMKASSKPKGQILKELWWSIRADLKLLSLALRENVHAEYERQGVPLEFSSDRTE